MKDEDAWQHYDEARRRTNTVPEALDLLRGNVRSVILLMKILREREGMTLAQARDVIAAMSNSEDFYT